MSHFIRCDRCDKQDHVMGTVSLPPGWQKILQMDLCEPCCQIVRDFIRFKPSDAERLPIEPIPTEATQSVATPDGKLFETAPVPQVSADSHQDEHSHASNGKAPVVATEGAPTGETQPVSAGSILFDPKAEASTEERRRTRKPKMQGQDAILPDNRPKAEPGAPA